MTGLKNQPNKNKIVKIACPSLSVINMKIWNKYMSGISGKKTRWLAGSGIQRWMFLDLIYYLMTLMIEQVYGLS